MPTPADDNTPAWSEGADENCGSSWPTHCHGMSSICTASSANCSDESVGPTRVLPPTVDLIKSDERLASRWERSPEMPAQYIGAVRSRGASPRKRSANSGRKRSSPGLPRIPLTSVILESPGLLRFLPELAERFLGEAP